MRQPVEEDPSLDRTYEALVFDWDGTAVADRGADATAVRARVESLCAAGVQVIVVSGTHVDNVDGQLRARPSGPGELYLCLNRGSEVFAVTGAGPALVSRRSATSEEEATLDQAAALTVGQLRARGLAAAIVSQRLNRRKIDLIGDPEWADPPKARIGELLGAVEASLAAVGIADLAEVVSIATDAARAAGLPDARVTTDVKHVEIGLTDKADSARWAADRLAQQGITGRLVLVVGDEFGSVGGVAGSDAFMLVPALARAHAVSVGVEPGGVPPGVHHVGGGPARFLDLLDDQLTRRRERRAPEIDDDPAWVVELPDDAASERVAEAIGALGNASAGIRGAREEDGPGTLPLFAVNGMYTGEKVPRLVEGPVWTNLDVRRGGRGGRRLDLRTGVLARRDTRSGLVSVRFLSDTRRNVGALRAEAVVGSLGTADPFGDGPHERVDRGGAQMARTTSAGGGITVAVRSRSETIAGRRTVERLALWDADPDRVPDWSEVAGALGELDCVGFDRLLAEHRSGWARRWSEVDVSIAGAPEDELAARFAVFNLLNAAPDAGEAAVGPRGLTGHGYGGHVFWDADVFVLPTLAAIRPGSARAMLEYRVRRLPAARAAAAAAGLDGARFPWESADDGADVTPRDLRGPGGQVVPIWTGEQEEHIVADVAWSAHEYACWTGDEEFLRGDGRALLLDTARYWASRVTVDDDGRGHLYGLMGPDEYHENVDDNAFTNVMARWNLRRAAALVEHGGRGVDAAAWRDLADRLVDGWDPEQGLYEQFTGYWDLDPLLAEHVAPRPFAADLLLGRARVAGSQLVKQADVVMLHHLVPGEVRPGSLLANLTHYEPRTTHGSSLSPAIHAALFARAGQPDRALEVFRLAARLDLDDLTGSTANGLHLATMGGLWQALAYGFLGLRPHGHHLDVDPCLPEVWHGLGLGLRFRGHPIHIRADHGSVRVDCEAPIAVRIGGGSPELCTPPMSVFELAHRRAGPDERSAR